MVLQDTLFNIVLFSLLELINWLMLFAERQAFIYLPFIYQATVSYNLVEDMLQYIIELFGYVKFIVLSGKL